jgi:hypothetical protein
LEDNVADAVISNGVLNLVLNKTRAFSEKGQRRCTQDGRWGQSQGRPLKIISEQCFTQVEVQIEKPITVPDDVIGKHLSAAKLWN